MRILLVGAGGVGSAIVAIAARREFAEAVVVADYDLARAEKAVAAVGDPRFSAIRADVSGHGDVPVAPAPRPPPGAARGQARRRAVRDGRGMGGRRAAGPRRDG